LLKSVSLSEDESAPKMFEIVIQRLETLAKKTLPLGACPKMSFFPITENIDRDDQLGGFAGRDEGGVVGQSKVTPKPVNNGCGAHVGA
jgi:hypothetical protein